MLISEDFRFYFALIVLIIGGIAVAMIPGAYKIKKRRAKWYARSGKYLVFALALVVLAAGGLLGVDWYREERENIWLTGDMILFLCFGLVLIAGNAMTIRKMKQLPSKVAKKVKRVETEDVVIEAEIIEAEVMEDPAPPKPVKRVQKVAKKKKKVKETRPPLKERFVQFCKSCGSEMGTDIIECPICGFDIEGTVQLECPACGQLNEEDAKKCGGCDAHFEM